MTDVASERRSPEEMRRELLERRLTHRSAEAAAARRKARARKREIRTLHGVVAYYARRYWDALKEMHLLAGLLTRAVSLIDHIEWSGTCSYGTWAACPWCGGKAPSMPPLGPEGHNLGCELARLLTDVASQRGSGSGSGS